MYLPKAFEVTDLPALHGLIERHPLATWATVRDGAVAINHVPFVLDRTRGPLGTLIGHVARANPVWQAPAAGVWVFQGPDAYISPNAYPSKREHGKAVPTWNYAVVHAHGTPIIHQDPVVLRDIVSRLTDQHESGEPAPWRVSDAPVDYLDAMLKAIVGIELPIERLVGKWKMSQNQPEANRAGVVNWLRSGVAADERTDAVARLVQQGPRP